MSKISLLIQGAKRTVLGFLSIKRKVKLNEVEFAFKYVKL